MSPLLLAALLTGPAAATDTWYDPHPGVRYLHRTDGTPWQIHALEVDLCARGVALRATQEGERQRTVSSFAGLVGAQAAINGDFFSYDGYWPSGMAVGASSYWNADNDWNGFVAFGQDKAWISDPVENWGEPADWMDEAVGGFPKLVEAGVALSSYSSAPDHCPDRHPRTAVGLSENRQTAWLVVVDGRSSSSAGMTCPELATLMVDLGAHSALNLDGGGSSAAWSEAYGVLNDPSDGSERTVANHLAVWASGTGSPESCDFWLEELVVGAHLLDQGPTDIDGDGLADACARAAAGLHCHASTGSSFSARWELTELSNDAGFSSESHYGTLRYGDIDGDGAADVCARGASGVRCWRGSTTGFGQTIMGPVLTDDTGWDGIDHWSTLRLADITGDGRDDLCARAAAGYRCYPAVDGGFGGAVELGDMGDDDGWALARYYGTIRTGDIDGDGKDDVCGRGAARVYCWTSEDDGFSDALEGPAWSDDAGWDDVSCWSTLRLVDVDGDGLADLCARGPDGFRCALSNGEGFDPEVAGPALSDDTGWGDHSNMATIRLADLDGDGDRDLLARADAGIRWWSWEGASAAFGDAVEGPELSDALGWDDHRYYSTLRTADIDGDGSADLCARDADGLACWLGPELATEIEGPGWSDESGWDDEPYYTTLRLGTATPMDDETTTPDDSGKDGPGLRFPEEGCGGCASQSRAPGLGWASLLVGLLGWRRR